METCMYIPSHEELGDHPKTKRAARSLRVSLPTMVGHLEFLWWWGLHYAPDGDVTQYDSSDLAEAARWEGDAELFVEALLTCGKEGPGFLEETPEGRMLLHDWFDYGGKLLKARRDHAAYVRRLRQQMALRRDGIDVDLIDPNRPPTEQGENDSTVTSTARDYHMTITSPSLASESHVSHKSRVEKSRLEDIRIESVPDSDDVILLINGVSFTRETHPSLPWDRIATMSVAEVAALLPPPSPPSERTPSKRAPVKEEPLSPNFALTPLMRLWAKEGEIHPKVDLDHQTDRFVEYYTEGEGQGTRRKNWELAWRNWIKRESDWAALGKGPYGEQPERMGRSLNGHAPRGTPPRPRSVAPGETPKVPERGPEVRAAHPCAVPGCDRESFHKYCDRHGVFPRYDTVRPEFASALPAGKPAKAKLASAEAKTETDEEEEDLF